MAQLYAPDPGKSHLVHPRGLNSTHGVVAAAGMGSSAQKNAGAISTKRIFRMVMPGKIMA